MLHIRMNHIMNMNESCHVNADLSKRLNRINECTHTNKSCREYEGVMSRKCRPEREIEVRQWRPPQPSTWELMWAGKSAMQRSSPAGFESILDWPRILWRHALAPEPRAARQGLESGHTLIVYGLLGILA